MTAVVELEAAGTELHLVVNGRHFEIPVTDGVVQRRDIIDLGYDARLGMQDLGALYRRIEAVGVSLDGAVYTARF